MRPAFARIVAVVVVVLLAYLVLRWPMTRSEATSETPADTMCLASRIGLRCAS